MLKPAAHHESFEKLWETKWKAPVSLVTSGTLVPITKHNTFIL